MAEYLCVKFLGIRVHSEKFKMIKEVDSFLSEKVSNLLLT